MTTARTPAPALETPPCPLCGEGAQRLVAARPAWEPHRVVACAACGFVYLSPRLDARATHALHASDRYYGEDADDGAPGYAAYAEQEHSLRLTFRRWLAALVRARGARRASADEALLEIGCGRGYLLAEAQRHFGRCEGTELSQHAARAAAKHADEIHVGGLEAVPAERRYDVVLSSQVIEHVHAPVDFLRAQVRHLAPGGTLAVATPWMGSPWQRALGVRWPSYKIPEHVLYFTPASLAEVMRRAGLTHIRRLSFPHAFPLALVAAKLGLRWPGGLAARLGRRALWIPGTTLAIAGERVG